MLCRGILRCGQGSTGPSCCAVPGDSMSSTAPAAADVVSSRWSPTPTSPGKSSASLLAHAPNRYRPARRSSSCRSTEARGGPPSTAPSPTGSSRLAAGARLDAHASTPSVCSRVLEAWVLQLLPAFPLPTSATLIHEIPFETLVGPWRTCRSCCCSKKNSSRLAGTARSKARG